MRGTDVLKKPKKEPKTEEDEEDREGPQNRFTQPLEEEKIGCAGSGSTSNSLQQREENEVAHDSDIDDDSNDLKDQEEVLIALVEHRTKEVEHLHKRVSYYQCQLVDMEKKLHESKSKLARLRRRSNDNSQKNVSPIKQPKSELRSGSPTQKLEGSPIQNLEGSTQSKHHGRSKLLIPDVKPRSSQPTQLLEPVRKVSSSSRDKADMSFCSEDKNSQVTGAKRKRVTEHTELIPMVCSSSSPRTIRCNSSTHISSQHKRKLRSLILCPVNDNLFMTSALDGVVNLWQLQSVGLGATRLSSTDCLSPKQRKWPEDIAWHPAGNCLFAAYTADSGDNQISLLDLNKTGRSRVTFLEEKPHVKGLINSIMFMPWEDAYFVTGGSDHAVILWGENSDEIWKPRTLHRNLHSSAVMGIAGMQHKKIVLSAGADRRVIGFDMLAGRADYKLQMESKCMSVLPNPCDFNLFMVQSGTPGKQLRLYDIRLRQTEIHGFGWKQESSESQSALINQAWSPDGLYLTSGSADPVIHIFDIRYNLQKPSQSVQAHQKRVFKAVWHSSAPVLTSISSDLNIGIHRVL